MSQLRQRYIVFEILSQNEASLSDKILMREIWKKISQIFGEITSFKAGLWLITWDSISKKGILRTEHFVDSEIIASLALIRKIGDQSIIFHTRKTTGTIKKAKKIWTEVFNVPLPSE